MQALVSKALDLLLHSCEKRFGMIGVSSLFVLALLKVDFQHGCPVMLLTLDLWHLLLQARHPFLDEDVMSMLLSCPLGVVAGEIKEECGAHTCCPHCLQRVSASPVLESHCITSGITLQISYKKHRSTEPFRFTKVAKHIKAPYQIKGTITHGLST